MKKKTPKPRNPADTTFRNLRAIKARVTVLEGLVGSLLDRVDTLETQQAIGAEPPSEPSDA